MGTPAESRSLVAHLINARIPYSYETPKFLLMCEGITELTEELNHIGKVLGVEPSILIEGMG